MAELGDAIDLFCGAGGASWGITKSGLYRSVRSYDSWPLAVETHHLNGMHAHLADLSTYRFPKQRIDLLWGSPPCQPFSGAVFNPGEWDERDGFPHYLRALRIIRPRLAIIENVAGATYKRHREYLTRIIMSIEALGYVVEWKVVDCSDYGIAQARKRLIIIARLDGAPCWPTKQEKKVSVYERLGTNGKDNPRGTDVIFTKSPTMHGGFRGALLFNGRGRPLDLEQPSLTIYASGGNHVHWFDTKHIALDYFDVLKRHGRKMIRKGRVPGAKRLTVEQMARLQHFPKRFRFAGPPSSQITQIGNAIPPRMARLLVEANAA